MTAALPVATPEGRKRAAHKKSRRGCRNCKLRRIKCDETRPQCKKCTSFGYNCNFSLMTPDLQMAFDGTSTIRDTTKPTAKTVPQDLSLARAAPNPSPPILFANDSALDLSKESWDRLARFRAREMPMIGTVKASVVFKETAAQLVSGAPYLMHAAQALTAIHDRYLCARPDPSMVVQESYHLSQTAHLFSKKLSASVLPSDRDALWATAALLSIIAFAYFDATTPEESWPLKKSDSRDLEWVKLGESKATIWKIAEPTRPDSLWVSSASEYVSVLQATMEKIEGIRGIPQVFVDLCDLDDQSSSENNPYYFAVHMLSPLLRMRFHKTHVLKFLTFHGHLEKQFKLLLELKDPRALLILAFWYAMTCKSIWWIERRAKLECQAICLYLERHHADDKRIQDLLFFPKTRCGLFEPQMNYNALMPSTEWSSDSGLDSISSISPETITSWNSSPEHRDLSAF